MRRENLTTSSGQGHLPSALLKVNICPPSPISRVHQQAERDSCLKEFGLHRSSDELSHLTKPSGLTKKNKLVHLSVGHIKVHMEHMLFLLLLPGAKRTERPRLNAFLKSAEQRANFLNITQTLTACLLDLCLEAVCV